MASFFSTSHLARISALHPKRVIIGWLVALALFGALAGTVNDSVVRYFNFLNEPESIQGYDLMEARFGITDQLQEIVVVQSVDTTVDDPAYRAAVQELTENLRSLDGIVASASNYYEASAAESPLAAEMVSEDRRTTVIPITFASYSAASDHIHDYEAVVDSVQPAGLAAYSAGQLTFDETQWAVSETDLRKAELIGIPIALLILVVVMGSLLGPVVPLLLAIGSIAIATGIAALLGRVYDLSFYAINMISLIGLAVGIDYAFFIVERYREERRRGLQRVDAIERTGGTANRAVLVSGLTVMLALLGLFMIPTTIFTSIGAGAIIVVIIALAAMLTLVPALLSLTGDRIDWPYWRRSTVATAHQRSRITAWLTKRVMSRPVVSAVLAAGFLLLLAIPVLDINTGMAGVEALPESDVKTGMRILQEEFNPGLASPVQVVIDGARTPETEAAVEALTVAMASDPGFTGQATVTWSELDTTALITQPLSVDPTAPEAYAAIQRLRNDVIPPIFSGLDATDVFVTGATAYRQDFFNSSNDAVLPVFLFVLGLSFIILLLAFRSLVVPVKAIIMNLLSVGAAYGALVLVFQKGYGADLLGFQQTPTVEAWIPIFLFCVLFGLSMDYHVFLLSRIREFYDQTGNNSESVAIGLQTTAKIITGAALIMVAVFSGFAAGRLVMFQQMGFGLAVAVFLDATVVRSVLVPASMALLGKQNWYFPSWLSWLPDLRVEGRILDEAEPAIEPSAAAD